MKIDIEWVKLAQKALIKSGIVSKNKYPKEFKGYISSLATSIVQMGLIPTLFIYENDNNNKGNNPTANNNRAYLVYAIEILLREKQIISSGKKTLLLYHFQNKSKNELDVYLRYINYSLIALKLALRFYLEDEEEKRTETITLDKINSPNNFEHSYGNIGWIFYRDLYRHFAQDCSIISNFTNTTPEEAEKEYVKRKITYILNSSLQSSNESPKKYINSYAPIFNNSTSIIHLKTTYPGLLIGSGLNHGLSDEGDIKIGFAFDYTSGLPYIPGSSVKGVLRSVFPTSDNDSRVKYLNKILNKNFEYTKYSELEKILFEGSGNNMVIYFDAFISESKNKDGRILGNDYITPHKEALKEPVPIQFLKVLPDVVFQFQFRIPPQFAYKDLRYKNIEDLFKKILIDLGIGAKTNVGYGHFLEYNDSQSQN